MASPHASYSGDAAPDLPHGEAADGVYQINGDEHPEDVFLDAAEFFSEMGFAEGAEAFHELQQEEDPYDKFDIGPIDWRLRLRWQPNRRQLILRDKFSFLLGSTQLWVCAYWLGAHPQTFWQLYTALGIFHFIVRFFSYRSKAMHYYLFDFCYYANLLLMAHLWLLPKSSLLHKVTFAYNAGPLTWSILAFRNSLVYHDIDKVTSLFLHLVPACVSWCMRWHPDAQRFGPVEGDREAWLASAGVRNMVAIPMVFYFVWAVFYYLKIFVISAKRIQQRGYHTLFTYVTSTKKGTFHAIAKRVPRQIQPLAYFIFHLSFTCTTLLIAMVCWNSFVLHTTMLAAMTSLSIWHGASFYFEVFSKRYYQSRVDGGKLTTGDTTPVPKAAATPQATAAWGHASGKQD